MSLTVLMTTDPLLHPLQDVFTLALKGGRKLAQVMQSQPKPYPWQQLRLRQAQSVLE